MSHYLNSIFRYLPAPGTFISRRVSPHVQDTKTLTRFSRKAGWPSSDKNVVSTSGTTALSVGTAPAHTCYVISTTRLTRIRGEAGARGRRAYRERERDSDSERRNVTRRACFAESLPAASGSPWTKSRAKPRVHTKDRRQVTTPSDDPQETPRISNWIQ